ncbi:hypothetical protein B9G69_014215 [Bdellovibrio sp. SKB1291214]|uniref:hypothetical protein n=1 Tax=Bdellovibrio sp. SKB1291214 TaxID=1732569 RepID=UPI001130158E|nr:hypothetical protein [Bdellovibrio sp. SKB1291214]UYL08203.1 hypothetical protein B9G69_014215 [Bdellovibrio sp. SKB1291214]
MEISVLLDEQEKLRILCDYHEVQPADSSLFKLLGKEIAWEIVDFNLNQIYRNEVIVNLGNYSIEEYESKSPWDLFTRSQIILEALIDATMRVKKANGVIYLNHIPPYVMEETMTPEKAQFRIEHLFVCPLVSNATNENTMFVSAFILHPLDQNYRVSIL